MLGSVAPMTVATEWRLICSGCGREEPDGPPDYCPDCGYPVLVSLERDLSAFRSLFDGHATGLWRYAPLFPVRSVHERATLGEGGTPCVPIARAGERIGIRSLHAKLDHLNPSGSFKDRGITVGIAAALEQNAPGVLCASSGNAAGSLATYAARAGLPAIIFVPRQTPPQKVAIAAAHGARLLFVEGDFSAPFQVAREAGQLLGWANLSTTYLNGYTVEGNKSVAYELYEQLGDAPDWVVIPISAGPLLFGVLRGFEDLRQMGLVDRIPRLAGIQPTGCAPIAQAFAAGADEVVAWEGVDTLVSGLNDPLRGYASDGTITLRAVRDSNGVAVAVEDAAIVEEIARLAAEEGLFVEPAAASALAGAARLRADGAIAADDRVVCLLTGHGFKQPVLPAPPEPVVVASLDDALREIASSRSASADVP
jgi:threonine synthase